MNGFNIVGGGDIEATIYGVDVRTLLGAQADLDFGTFLAPSSFALDMGSF
jgi:hypothetical protein